MFAMGVGELGACALREQLGGCGCGSGDGD